MQKSQEEIDAMTPAERKAYDLEQTKIVFGHDVQFDAKGNPIEQGFGSAQNQTVQHRQALERERARQRAS